MVHSYLFKEWLLCTLKNSIVIAYQIKQTKLKGCTKHKELKNRCKNSQGHYFSTLKHTVLDSAWTFYSFSAPGVFWFYDKMTKCILWLNGSIACLCSHHLRPRFESWYHFSFFIFFFKFQAQKRNFVINFLLHFDVFKKQVGWGIHSNNKIVGFDHQCLVPLPIQNYFVQGWKPKGCKFLNPKGHISHLKKRRFAECTKREGLKKGKSCKRRPTHCTTRAAVPCLELEWGVANCVVNMKINKSRIRQLCWRSSENQTVNLDNR